MATPPLPDNPSIRVRLIWTTGSGGLMGCRFFLNSTGTPPFAGANLATLNGDISSLHHTELAPLFNDNFVLTEIDVLDISSRMGAASTLTYSDPGTRGANTLPDNCATNVEFDIAERYRGGKPRIYLPPGLNGDLETTSTYTSAFVTTVKANVTSFFEGIEALSVTGLGTLDHVLLSYYEGVSKTSPPWRGPGYKYPPAYRSPNAVSFPVIGYAPKTIVGSQRRRRTSTTP